MTMNVLGIDGSAPATSVFMTSQGGPIVRTCHIGRKYRPPSPLTM